MSRNVFANGREISAKADSNKSIAAMPDVCLSPPSPPAGPLPIPYPNFSEASDSNSGSKNVKIGKKEVGMKNKSDYKSSKGNEAATRSFGMGVVSHNLQGKTQHAAWSSDVKVEKANVIRHMDLTTHNHGSGTNGAITIDAAGNAMGTGKLTCKQLRRLNSHKRKKAGRAGINDTITHGTYTPKGGAPKTVWSSSRKLGSLYSNGRSRGLPRQKVGMRTNKAGQQSKVTQAAKSKACADATSAKKDEGFKYTRRRDNPHTSHTESRIIEEIFMGMHGPMKGKLRLAINWNKHRGKKPAAAHACPDCERLICAALICGIEIELCGKNGKKPPVPQSDDDCPKDLSKNSTK